MRILHASLVLVSCLACVEAQRRLSLDGTWELGVAPAESPAGPASYDRPVAVPAAFETALGEGFDGVVWYRRQVPLSAEWRGAIVRVEFAAVATHATVFCNGTMVAEHLGGWTPFRADLTSALRWDGTDTLEVRVDERVGHNTQGFLPIIQPHFGGIWQSVTLCVDTGPVIDRLTAFSFGSFEEFGVDDRGGPGVATLPVVRARTSVLPGAGAPAVRQRLEVLDGSTEVASATRGLAADGDNEVWLALPDGARAWRPGAPHLYRLRVSILDGDGRVLDVLERRVGFRKLTTAGTTIQWNGAPMQVRGVLHWGYSPPHLAPPADRSYWRRELERFRALGFNTIKCCLWVPPPCLYELCDELGMLCWQEYPTWHPQMDQAHKQELLDEYSEFHLLDGSHPSVAFRSITCETGQGADLDVVTALYEQCKRCVPDTLVVDDSSWIGWQRITDFWDEHPYGNNRWWPGRLQEFARHIAEKGEKPLLLGECIAADTWIYRDEWRAVHGDEQPWWQPLCMPAQAEFERWILDRFGAATLRSLGPISREYAMTTRRYQIERLRMDLPFAGYVVSVARDFGKARMGLVDAFDVMKWSAAEWAWQDDTMLCLDTAGDRRAFVVGADPTITPGMRAVTATTVGPRQDLQPLPRVTAPTRVTLQGAAAGRTARWQVWALPPFAAAPPGGVRVVDHLDPAVLDQLEAGGRVLLRATDDKHSWQSHGLWYLRGAPIAPPHPVHAALPAELLVDLQPFDLDGGRAIDAGPIRDEVDPILMFWDTHDIAEVRTHLFAFDTRVGAGRLLVSAFDHDTDAGRFVEQRLLEHLAAGPAPQRALAPATVGGLRGILTQKKLDLPTWRFRVDPEDQGRAAQWFLPRTNVAGTDWRDLRAGSHWENQGEDLAHYTGIAWYRVDVDIPADWQGLEARAVFEGVDDSFEFWLDGAPVGTFGDPETHATVWLERQVTELGAALTPGRHTLVLRVVDHGGAGGLWKPVFLTTGPTDQSSRLLR